ncbi:hypothetical protein ALI44B_00230 [Leifsonia sp. ALI-44-B]|nr:hypothetical protein ALI44B_00230 [Leifsonia sp. ALI-44-B]
MNGPWAEYRNRLDDRWSIIEYADRIILSARSTAITRDGRPYWRQDWSEIFHVRPVGRPERPALR